MGSTSPKNRVTEQLRQMIGQLALLRETDEAEASLCALSFQSITVPSRHVWIDTDLDEVGIGLDLEDWQRNDEWDDAVAHVKASSLLDAVEIAVILLPVSNFKFQRRCRTGIPISIKNIG